jgi:ABC-2 type transport system ATP-binding protein
MTTILEVENVSKTFGDHKAVDEVSFKIVGGGIYGLLGPNGAGKTTLIRMICFITLPDAGEIRFEGKPLNPASQRRMGYLPEERGLYRKMKVGEHLEYLLRLKGMDAPTARRQTQHMLERFALAETRNKKVGELSKGMQQKVQFIATVAHRPPLVILDEPFSGLDPINAQIVEDMLYELRNDGTAVLLSTHRMEQAERFCEHIFMMHRGKLVIDGAMRDLLIRHAQPIYDLETEEKLADDFSFPGQMERHAYGGTWNVVSHPNDLFWAAAQNHTVIKFARRTPTLREVFIATAADVPAADVSNQTH